MISAHRMADGSGEVRLSLSNPFDEKGAEGFRAELYATDRAQDVAVLMQDLLRECNVQSVTTLADVFPTSTPGRGCRCCSVPTRWTARATNHSFGAIALRRWPEVHGLMAFGKMFPNWACRSILQKSTSFDLGLMPF